MFLSDVSIKRPVFATMMMVALVTLGLFSYRRLSIDQWPDISFPFIVVQTVYPGRLAGDGRARRHPQDRGGGQPDRRGAEPDLALRSRGFSSIFIEFELKIDQMDAQQDVRAKIDQIRDELPDDIEKPLVLRFDPQDIPIVSLALRSDTRTLRELTTIADETIRKELEGVDGVGQVTIIGGEKRAIVVELDPERLAARAVTVGQVMATLGAENMEIPGRDGSSWVPASSSCAWPDASGSRPTSTDLVVDVRGGRADPPRRRRPDRSTTPRRRARRRSSTAPPPSASTSARSQARTPSRSPTSVKTKVDELRGRLPGGVELSIVRDNSVWIRDSVEDVEDDDPHRRAPHRARRLHLPELVALDRDHRAHAAGVGHRRRSWRSTPSATRSTR